MNGYSIPKATLGRLPQYLEYLRSLPEIRRTISATAIAKALSLGDVQVRKDLAVVSGAGKPKIGYETDQLITDIESHLGYERLTNAVLVGAGKLGRALLDYDGFENFGVKIIAGFDCNETALKKGAKDILPIRDIGAYCREHKVTNTREVTVMITRPPSPPFQTVQLHRMRKQFRQIDETAYFY